MPPQRRAAGGRVVAVIAVLVAVLYPLVVYVGLNRLEPRSLALLLAVLLLGRLLLGRLRRGSPAKPAAAGQGEARRALPVLFAGVLILGMFLYTLVTNNASALKLYPVIVSFSLLLGFSHSLLHPPSAIERLARLTNPHLSPAGARYTRRVTFVWCGFFFGNGCVALYTTVWSSLQTWTLYNGVISYLLIAGLLGGEYLYRHCVIKA